LPSPVIAYRLIKSINPVFIRSFSIIRHCGNVDNNCFLARYSGKAMINSLGYSNNLGLFNAQFKLCQFPLGRGAVPGIVEGKENLTVYTAEMIILQGVVVPPFNNPGFCRSDVDLPKSLKELVIIA